MDVTNATAARLRNELEYLREDSSGSRSDLIARLRSRECYQLSSDFRVVEKIAGISDGANIWSVHGKNQPRPLLEGDFQKKTVTIAQIFNIESCDFDPEVDGNEGDLRRFGSKLFMYKTHNCLPGWYPLLFGPVRVI
jgi:hypothetical protein